MKRSREAEAGDHRPCRDVRRRVVHTSRKRPLEGLVIPQRVTKKPRGDIADVLLATGPPTPEPAELAERVAVYDRYTVANQLLRELHRNRPDRMIVLAN